MKLLLPGCDLYLKYMAIPPPNKGDTNYVVRPGGDGLMEAVTDDELDEYLLSGEYDERLDEIDDEISVPTNMSLRSDVLYLPDEVVFSGIIT